MIYAFNDKLEKHKIVVIEKTVTATGAGTFGTDLYQQEVHQAGIDNLKNYSVLTIEQRKTDSDFWSNNLIDSSLIYPRISWIEDSGTLFGRVYAKCNDAEGGTFKVRIVFLQITQ